MITELTRWSFMGLGFVGGTIFGLCYYEMVIGKAVKARLKAAMCGLNDALVAFGISKDSDGKWLMKPKDRDEVWIRKEG